MLRLLRIYAFVYLAVFFHGVAQAQDLSGPAFSVDAKTLLKAGNDLKQEKPSVVTVLFRENIFEFDKQSKLVETSRMIYRVNNAEGVDSWSESSARWEPWHQSRPEIRTRVITPGGEVRELDPKTLTDRPVHEDSTIYTDDRILAAPIPALSPGAIVEEQIITRDTAPFFSAGIARVMYFVEAVPVVQTRLVLKHPSSVPLTYKEKLLPKAVAEKHESEGVEEVTIENGSSEPYEDIEHVPSDAVLYPQVVFSTGSSWHDIASTYAQVAEQRMQQHVSDKDLHSDAAGDLPPAEKIRRLVATLHQHVRYTGVEFGESALIPQSPADTWKRGYGDCKDKAALLVSLLRDAGIPAHLALLQTGPGSDTDPSFPGMGVFDHAIVFIPGNPARWIDATAEFSPTDSLPEDDQGRLALVIDDSTTELSKTWEAKPQDNLLVENRDVHLSEYGPARITESWEPHGEVEAEYRSYYTPEQTEKRKKELETYVKSAYLAESLSKMEAGENSNLLKPFQMKLEVDRGRRGFTGLEDAVVVIQHAYLTDRLPSELRTEKPKDSEEKKRTVDYVIDPFVAEWRYHIYPPAGFEVRNLPAPVNRKLGSALLTETFAAEKDGSVSATLRFDTVKSRFTPDEAEALRQAVAKFRDEDQLELSFDHTGHALMAKGRIAEGLAQYRTLASATPKSALAYTRFADALLTAGLGEKARGVAADAVKLDPKSAPAYFELGWIREHDLIGRYLKYGCDYQGSVEAFKKAIALDPKDYQARINLAITYEYDAWGLRYTRNARLNDAVDEFRKLKKDDESRFARYQDNVLYDLFYARRFQEVLDEAAGLPMSDERRTLIVAATLGAQNAEAAEKKASDLSSDDSARNKILVGAGRMALRLRLYDQGVALLTAGTQGSADAQVTQQQIALFAKTKHSEDLKVDDNDPTSPIQKLARIWFRLDADPAEYLALMSKNAVGESREKDLADTRKVLPGLKQIVIDSGLPPDVFMDFVLSNMRITREGDDEHGYRESVQTPGAAAQYFYVVREEGQYKILGISQSNEVGREVLQRLARGDTASAKVMLDFVRDRQPRGGGDDPLAGNPFPRFWTKGQEADENTMRSAALILVSATDVAKNYLTDLTSAREKAPETQRSTFDLALALAYSKLHRWQELKDSSQQLLKAYPRSDRALALFTDACIALKDWPCAENAVHDRLAAEPDSLVAQRLSARVLAEKGDFQGANQALRKIAEDSRASVDDLNLFGWSGLFLPSVPPDGLEAAERGTTITQNKQFAIMHTLACLYADVGKPVEARNLFIKALEIAHLTEPNSELWYGFGRLAEVYGQYDAALTAYKRVEAPEVSNAFNTYNLVQQRMKNLMNKYPEESKSGN